MKAILLAAAALAACAMPMPATGENTTEKYSATYAVRGLTQVTLPAAVLSSGTEVMVSWGDGTREAFTCKPGAEDDTVTITHTYRSDHADRASLNVRCGSLDFGEADGEEYGRFTVTDGTKVIIREKLLLDGVFTVCDIPVKKVRFTRGNLMARMDEAGDSVTKWKLADRQYDCAGSTAAQRQCRDGWVDLFAWTPEGLYGDGVRQYGISTSDKEADYVAKGEADICCGWTSLLGEGLTLLSVEEWHHLLTNRSARNSRGRYDFTIAGTSCSILLPDGFDGTVQDSYTADEWRTAEKAGLVAIPYGGARCGSETESFGHIGYCWTATPYPGFDYAAYCVVASMTNASAGGINRKVGGFVRMVSVM